MIAVSASRREEIVVTALAPEKSAVDRFADPLYSLAEASRFLGLSESTFRSWARGYDPHIQGRRVTGNPVITALGTPGQRGASIPFVGLAECYALAAMRRAGVPLQRIRPALEQLNRWVGSARHAEWDTAAHATRGGIICPRTTAGLHQHAATRPMRRR